MTKRIGICVVAAGLILSASSAPTGRPVMIMSKALASPINRGRRTVPPSTKGAPQRRQNTPKNASSSMTRRSHSKASSSPPATAYPLTAAMAGLDNFMREGPMGASFCVSHRWKVPFDIDFRS